MSEAEKNQQKISSGKVVSVMAGLAAFGVAYNWLVGRLEEEGLDEGYTADLVVGGTLATVVATAPLIGWRRVALVLAAFGASGLPMKVGSMLRYRLMRRREQSYVGIGEWQRGNGAGPVTAAGLQATGKAGRGGARSTGRITVTE